DALQQFVRLSPLRTHPSPPDRGLKLVEKKIPWRPEALAKEARWDVILPCWLSGKDTPGVFVGNAREVRRADAPGPAFAFPSGAKAVPPTPSGILAVDWNNDHATDFLLAGAGGLRFYQQKPDGTFADVTDRT